LHFFYTGRALMSETIFQGAFTGGLAMRAISSIPTYAPSRASERNGRQSSALRLRRADEIRRSRRLQMMLAIAIPILLVTYLTLGIIRCVFIVSDVVQNTILIPSATLRADQR
jgi:hypothetical protein